MEFCFMVLVMDGGMLCVWCCLVCVEDFSEGIGIVFYSGFFDFSFGFWYCYMFLLVVLRLVFSVF